MSSGGQTAEYVRIYVCMCLRLLLFFLFFPLCVCSFAGSCGGHRPPHATRRFSAAAKSWWPPPACNPPLHGNNTPNEFATACLAFAHLLPRPSRLANGAAERSSSRQAWASISLVSPSSCNILCSPRLCCHTAALRLGFPPSVSGHANASRRPSGRDPAILHPPCH